MQILGSALNQREIELTAFDHFAIIDLPGPHSGIPILQEIFTDLGFVERGKDYLADKQNDFLWMAEADCLSKPARDVLPQVVVADFRLEEMPNEISQIIKKYSSQCPDHLSTIRELIKKEKFQPCLDLLLNYFSGRDWSLPTVNEFYLVQEFNELLAWVLVFGRRPNHFTVPVHLLDQFADLADFHAFIEEDTTLTLNKLGRIIKGGKANGIAQGSTMGVIKTIKLADGEIEIPTDFIEFVWRYPVGDMQHQGRWSDYFTDFVANHADRVIESLYTND